MPSREPLELPEELATLVPREGGGEAPLREPPGPAALRSLALWLHDHGHGPEAELCFRSAYARSLREGPEELAVASALDLARNFRDRSPREALRLVRWVSGRTDGRRATVQNLLGAILSELCSYEQAEAYFARAIEQAERREDRRCLAYVMANRAGNHFDLGDRSRARASHLRALEALRALEEEAGVGFVLRNMAAHELVLGEYEAAMERVEEARRLQRAPAHLALRAFLDLTDGELELLTGDRSRAVERFEEALRGAGLASRPGLQAKARVWRTIARDEEGGGELLGDLESAGRDLHQRELRHDSGAIYLVAACYADRRGLRSERFRSTAVGILGEETAGMLCDHFARMIEAARGPSARPEREPLPRFLTRSSRIRDAKRRLRRVAGTDVRILIEGESGTGKSFLARRIHQEGRRKGAAFVVVDCTNLEENLFESKLFGHVRGAFTGAVSDAVGLVEQANGGTLFLDEVGEMPVEIQAKLLYTIEEQRYRPVGARSERRASFQVIAATNRDVEEMLRDGELRRDLYYRLSGYRVWLPPLRERREDVVPLTEHRMRWLNERYGRKKTLRPAVWDLLVRYDWPGNVRELNATLERGYHLAEGRRIGVEDLGLGLDPDALDAEDLSWYVVRRNHLLRVLRLCRGNVTRAADLLGLNRTTLIYKLKLLDLDRSDFDPSYRDAENEAPRMVAERDDDS
ncbi:MAG: sigma 54-interacting transcriptional regulator [Gemmatimonadota bacterium]|nr:sigma 54-interacting transcriptional regulator [Gemmatimonadota bacterium]